VRARRRRLGPHGRSFFPITCWVALAPKAEWDGEGALALLEALFYSWESPNGAVVAGSIYCKPPPFYP
jgi:hypothetical protein